MPGAGVAHRAIHARRAMPEAARGAWRGETRAIVLTMRQLGVQMIPADSPQARGRCERMFATHQQRLPKARAACGITTMAEANRYGAEHDRAAFNEECAVPAAESGSAFVPFIGPGLTDIVCEHHERTVGRDLCVRFERKRLQSPAHAWIGALPDASHRHILIGRLSMRLPSRTIRWRMSHCLRLPVGRAADYIENEPLNAFQLDY